MKPAISVMSLLLLLLLATTSQGIRLEEQSLAAFHMKTQEGSFMRGGNGGGGAVLCRDDEHCSGMSRKLITKPTSTSKIEQSKVTELDGTERHHSKEEADGNHEDLLVKPPVSEHRQLPPETYPDIIDIAGMDYSPAKRKPPIHN